MKLTRRLFLAWLGAALASLRATFARAQPVATATVTFVLTNDIYLMDAQEGSDGKTRGGFARLASAVKAERAKSGRVIFAHGGDTLSPSLMSGLDQGAHIVTLTNMIRPDIFVPGNHEFDFGKAVFLKRMAEAQFPLYAANLRAADASPLPGFKDRAILEIDGVKIGLTGMAYQRSPNTSSTEDLRFASTIETTKMQAAALRQEGADFVVAVMHCDRGDSLALQFTQAADLMLTGHTHDLFVTYDERSAIVESSYDAHYVTAIDVTITVTEKNGKRITKWWPQFRIIDTATLTPDPEVAEAVAGFQAVLKRELSAPLATTAVELDTRSATLRTGEAVVGNLVADAMRLSTRADGAVMNGGGIRAGKVYPPGLVITRQDVLAELPFGNHVIVVSIDGTGLRAAMENGLARLPTPSGRFPQVSGMTVRFDPAKPPGHRVLAVTIDGQPLQDERRYRVAINDFIARGGDDYTMFKNADRITPDYDAPLLANAVMDHLKALGTIRSGIEGRVKAE
ncbi:MAG: bifunctional UDP-sugar hydrolase/5'-nucleotidase [Variibacter sp.]